VNLRENPKPIEITRTERCRAQILENPRAGAGRDADGSKFRSESF
jgi:hypothetical protein